MISALACAAVLSIQPAVEQHVKVVVQTSFHMVQPEQDGTAGMRRGVLTSADVQRIAQGVEQFRLEASGERSPVIVHLQTEETPRAMVIQKVEGEQPDPVLNGLEDDLAPDLNQYRFDSDDGVFRGPFEAVFYIHPALTSISSQTQVSGVPVFTVPYHTFARTADPSALADYMERAYRSRTGQPMGQAPAALRFAEGDLESSQKTENGATFTEVLLLGLNVQGGKNILGPFTDQSAINPSETPILSLRVRGTGIDPTGLTFLGQNGNALGSIGLFGQPHQPVEWSKPPIPSLGLAVGQWHNVKIDLRPIVGENRIYAVQAGAIESSPLFERRTNGALSLNIASASVEPEGDGAAAMSIRPNPTPVSAPMADRLATGDTPVLFNALLEATGPAGAGSEEALGKAAESGVPMTAFLGSRALAAIETEEATLQLVRVASTSAIEHARQFALEALGTSAAPIPLNTLSTQLLRRNWRLRRESIVRLGSRPEPEAHLAMIAGYSDPVSAVRLEVAKRGKIDQPVVSRRLLFMAFNDPSELVRATVLSRLLDSPIDTIRTEAHTGVRDESPRVQIMLLERMKERANAQDRAALRIAIIDQNPAVRAAALDAFTAQPDPIQPGEVQNLFQDDSEAVQLALVRASLAGRLALPEATVTRLKQSPHAAVRQEADKIDSSR